jgi:hypothetical protein
MVFDGPCGPGRVVLITGPRRRWAPRGAIQACARAVVRIRPGGGDPAPVLGYTRAGREPSLLLRGTDAC